MKKRILGTFLAICMILCFAPLAFAANDGDGASLTGVEIVGDFTVTGGTLGVDFKYENNVLTILSDKEITIENTNSGATTDRIAVADGVSAKITLAGVNIDVSAIENAAAFSIADDSAGDVILMLAENSNNVLKSGKYRAGLQKNGGVETGTLEIKGAGSLEAVGGMYCPGIGSSSRLTEVHHASYITISGGKVSAQGGDYGAGIGGGIDGSAENITITGGAVIAKGGDNGAGIGGGYKGSGINISISDGTVTAKGGSRGQTPGSTTEPPGAGAGIGGGYEGSCDKITISGGSVLATAGSDTNAIGGGKGQNAVTPTNGTENVYLCEIENPRDEEVTIDGVPYPLLNHKAADPNDGKLYVYLTNRTHVVTVGDDTIKYYFLNNGFFKFELDFVITGNDLIEGQDYTYEWNVLTVKSEKPITIANQYPDKRTTTNRIEVADGVNANIILNGVNINSYQTGDYEYAPFKIAENSKGNVTLTLADGSKNYLIGGYNRPGLYKKSDSTSGTLTIQGGELGTGTLEALGGTNCSGIGGATYDGGGLSGFASNIVINSGAIIAKGAFGAGIDCENITINGGTVTATGDDNAAGIGGCKGYSGSNIAINGGTVVATGGWDAAGIGGGEGGNGKNIKITGGTVTSTGGINGAGIGGGKIGVGEAITIAGGSVNAIAGLHGSPIGGGCKINYTPNPVTPTNGSEDVFLCEIPNPNSEDITIDGRFYTPVNHTAADPSGTTLYAYLTGETHVITIGNNEIHYHFDTDKETFFEGSPSSAFSHDADFHWYACTTEGCNYKFAEERHSGGTVTPAEKATCEVCGEKYGSNLSRSIVRFDANGGLGKMKYIVVDNNVDFALPANVFSNGNLVFDGWNTEKDRSGTSYADGQSLKTNEDLTLYAQWRNLYVFHVDFDANGGVGTMPSQEFTEGKEGALDANAFTREGYTFDGWNTMPDGSGTSYTDGDTITVAGNTTLYAMWFDNANTLYSVTVSANISGNPASADISSGTKGTLVHLKAKEYVADLDFGRMWFFSHWKIVSGDVQVINNSFVIGASDVHIEAVYSKDGGGINCCTITYVSNNNNHKEDSELCFGSTFASECHFYNPGFTFTGWNTKTDGSGMSIAAGQTIEISSDITLYAQWECSKHIGGISTCTEQATCMVCGEKYGELKPHRYSSVWSTDNTAHWHVCLACGTNGEESRHADNDSDHKCDVCDKKISDHAGGLATCTEQATCEICGERYGELKAHDYSEEWFMSETTHWHKCITCGAKENEAKHADADSDHKCDTCSAVLNECSDNDRDHKCDICGKVLTECADADNDHRCDLCAAVLTECVDNNRDHKCDVCGKKFSEHSGGTATCTERAICEVCGQGYGEKDPSNHTGKTEWVLTPTTHMKKYQCCGTVLVAEENHKMESGVCAACGYGCQHKGGVATCTEQATCEICGHRYGELKPHDYSVEWSASEVTHWHVCSICGAKSDEAQHADGNNDHACDVCSTVLSQCLDGNSDHKCDVCGAILTECADSNRDHKCDVCGKVLSECADRDNDHKCDLCGKKLSEHSGGTATCIEQATCEVCGEEYGTVDESNHSSLQHIPATAATKTSEGNIEYWRCSGCGKYFKDAAATNEIAKEDVVIAKLPNDDDNEKPDSGKTPGDGKTPEDEKASDYGNASGGEKATASGNGNSATENGNTGIDNNAAKQKTEGAAILQTGDDSGFALGTALLFAGGSAAIGATAYGLKRKREK